MFIYENIEKEPYSQISVNPVLTVRLLNSTFCFIDEL